MALAYDLKDINNALKHSIDMNAEAQKSRGDFQRKVLMNKISDAQERRLYSWKGEQDVAKKKRMAPFELEQERKKKQIMSPMEQLKYDRAKGADTTSGEFEPQPDGTMKRLNLKDQAEKVYSKPKTEWTPEDYDLVDRYAEFTRVGKKSNEVMTDPVRTDRFYNKMKQLVDSGQGAVVEEDLVKNFNTYQKMGVDVASILDKIMSEPTAQNAGGKWSRIRQAFMNLISTTQEAD